jgi:hypothetical protein
MATQESSSLSSVARYRIVVRQFEPTTGAAQQAAPGLWPSRGLYPELGVRIRQPKTKGWQVSQLFPLATDPEPQPSEAEIGRLKKAWRTWTASPTKPDRGGDSAGKGEQVLSKPYRVNVTFVRDDGHLVPGKITSDIHVRPPLAVKVRRLILDGHA